MRPDGEFVAEMHALEAAYLELDDPMVQSGLWGGRPRWCAERSPLVEAIGRGGDVIDVGCTNGLLAADVVDWAWERGQYWDYASRHHCAGLLRWLSGT